MWRLQLLIEDLKKRSYARLARIFEQSRNKWRAKAIERHKRIRVLNQKNKEPLSYDKGTKDTPAHKLVEVEDEPVLLDE